MKKRLFALLLAAAMLLALCACGGGTSSAEAPASAAETEAAAETAAPASAAPAPVAPAASTEESAAEPVVPANSVEYPIPGDHTLTMVGVMRMNAAEALNGGTYTETPPYDAMKEATGVSLDMELLAESTYSEKMNLMMASGDLPDMFSQTAAQYDNNMMAGIEDGILIDMADLLEENAPDYKALLDSDPKFSAGVYNTDGSISQFCGRSISRVSQGLLIRQDWLNDLNMEAPKNLTSSPTYSGPLRTKRAPPCPCW